ncbi:MAG: hypothetical protein KatS3mg015_1373 [Fimbriimonadales bacterium]|nr:MAG: hypothetical protein KatS3mg015_1373 [Fimbriimonadales bacterium]
MRLSEWAAKKKMGIFERLMEGKPPDEGEFDERVLREAFDKGAPQVGSTRFEPNAVICEFVFPDPETRATVFTVRLAPPERIVFLPVPKWVIQDIWQGEVAGAYFFESEANALVESFLQDLEPQANARFFGPQPPTRRE